MFAPLLLSPNSLCSPHERPVNPRDEVLRQGVRLYLESWLTDKMTDSYLKITIFWGAWMSGFYGSEMGVGKETKII